MTGPLAGIRVLDLSRLLPGGYCSLLLSDYGADVLKVEDTGMGDYIRWMPPQHEGADPTAAGAAFLSICRGKRSIRIDLKTEYGREGPDRDRPGHDIDYLARSGLLGLSGTPEGPPVTAAGQIADLGGGALMAAFGILAALHERARSRAGQLIDVSMTRGAQSWLAMDAARHFAGAAAPRR